MLAIKKSLITLLTSTAVTTASAVPTISYLDYQDPYYQSDNELLLKKMIRKDIDSDSVYFKTDKIYHYENQEYTDRDTIVNKFLDKNPIIAQRTTSNPSLNSHDYIQAHFFFISMASKSLFRVTAFGSSFGCKQAQLRACSMLFLLDLCIKSY